MNTNIEHQVKKLINSGYFDAHWYRSKYLDVDMVGIDPALHYIKYGNLMRRDPGPDFPSIFYRTVFNFKDDQEPVTRIADLRRRNGVEPEPNRKKILLAAAEVAKRGQPDMAVQLAERYLPQELAYSANIIRANAAVAARDEQAWLEHVNSYFSYFDISPISLSGTGSLFQRLRSTPEEYITGGPLISVLMPAFNAEKSIRMAVQSLLEQSWRNLEILVVDDCSEDATWSILKDLAASDSRLRIFRNATNVGPYVSKNIAASQSRGEWITGHDADDWAHPQRLERQWRFCVENNYDTCMSGILRMAADGTFVRLNPIKGYVHDGACRGGLISLMVRAQYFHDVLGRWDNVRVGGDSELLSRINRVSRSDIRQLRVVTMLCLDNPEGLTNHEVFGSKNGLTSPHRVSYRDEYKAYHTNLDKTTTHYPILSDERYFYKQGELLNKDFAEKDLFKEYEDQGVSIETDISVDVAIITNLRFPGGNASSTLDELEYFTSKGLKVALIHCPIDQNLGRQLSDRYDPWKHLTYNWSRIGQVSTKVLICRHPRVVTSSAFERIKSKLHAEHCFVVKNNSCLRATGEPVYDIGEMVQAMHSIDVRRVVFCPISPVMREELETFREASSSSLDISSIDWTPTFDLSLYRQPPKTQMAAPFRIGRHGRDGPEKWYEDPEILRKICPSDPDFVIEILGGANKAEEILGGLPDNWNVQIFGSVEPYEYLASLDAFVYFPSVGLVEGFGRTIVEAMLAGVPVVLPQTFAKTFGDLPIYCEPTDVEQTIRRLAASDTSDRIRYLNEVQEIAVSRFASPVIAERVKEAGLTGIDVVSFDQKHLSEASRYFRKQIGSL